MTENKISGKEIAQRLSKENPSIRDKAWNNTKKLILSKQVQNEDEMKEIWIGMYFWYSLFSGSASIKSLTFRL